MKTVLTTLALLSATAVSRLVGQGDSQHTRKTLAGVKGVCVAVEPIKEDAERDGLGRDQVNTDVELKLRQAGVTVLTQEQALSSAGAVYLHVNVHTLKSTQGDLYAYDVHLEVHQPVRLIRDPTVAALAATWSVGSLGLAGAERLRSVRDIVRDQTDQFINAYLAANPKR